MSCVPQPAAKIPPSGEKARQFTEASWCSSTKPHKSGTENSVTFFAVVPTARTSAVADANAVQRTSPSTVTLPTAPRAPKTFHTVTAERASPAATKRPLPE